MFASASRSDDAAASGLPADLPDFVRVAARLRLEAAGSAAATRIRERHEAGAFRFRFPNGSGPGREAMLVNIAGGLAGGDRLQMQLGAQEAASLTVSSATAERIYRSAGADTRISLDVTLEDQAAFAFLPQETILQEGARLRRTLTLRLAPEARLLLGEMLCFGHAARMEPFKSGLFHDSWRIYRDGRLILAEETRIAGDFAQSLAMPACLGAKRAMAVLLLAGPACAETLPALRAVLARHPAIEAGASAPDGASGLVIARFLAEDGAALRVAFAEAVRAIAPADLRLPRLFML